MARKQTPIEQVDLAVADVAEPARHALPVRVAGWVAELADQPPLIAICAGTLLAGLLRRDAKLADTGGRMLAAELVATAAKSAIKHRVDRTRPHVRADGGDYRMEPGGSPHGPLSSFPSGHTAGAVAVARVVARAYPRLRPAAYGAAAFVAAVQLPRCRHFVSDVAAGALVGLGSEAGVHAATRRLAGAMAD